MTYQDAYDQTLEKLKEQGKLHNSQLIELVEYNAEYMASIRSELKASGWAVET